MNLTRCNQGHFYDADKYSVCPHCNNGASDAAEEVMQHTVPGDSLMDSYSAVTPPENTPSVENDYQPGTLKSEVDDVQKTVGMFDVKKGAKQPVAGWLVCVEGPHFGEDFRIEMGRNFIGRARNMDIVLANDNSVSRDKHAIIVYEPKENMFIIQAGDSKELFYLNDKVVLSPCELNPYDNIKIGSSMLLFVPFCSKDFNWNDITKED